MDTVVFACVQNAGRSQMAAGFFNLLADPSRAQGLSAGTRPAARVHPVVIEAMREAGIDIGQNVPQRLTEDVARGASLMVTMGCGDECPIVPGLEHDDWPLADPKDQPLDRVREIREEIRTRILALLESRGWLGNIPAVSRSRG
jgi:arsenate reductase (thioredoxin)